MHDYLLGHGTPLSLTRNDAEYIYIIEMELSDSDFGCQRRGIFVPIMINQNTQV